MPAYYRSWATATWCGALEHWIATGDGWDDLFDDGEAHGPDPMTSRAAPSVPDVSGIPEWARREIAERGVVAAQAAVDAVARDAKAVPPGGRRAVEVVDLLDDLGGEIG